MRKTKSITGKYNELKYKREPIFKEGKESVKKIS